VTICYPLSTGKWLQSEWPWMTLNGYFITKCVFGQHFLNQNVWMSEIVQPLRFCGVLCIARSVSQPRYRHAQLTRCFSAVGELLVSGGLHKNFFSARVTFRPFRVIQGHLFWYQSKARMRLPISPWSYLAPFQSYCKFVLHLTPPLFHPNFRGVAVEPDRPCWGQPAHKP